jgi:hypothetical protein
MQNSRAADKTSGEAQNGNGSIVRCRAFEKTELNRKRTGGWFLAPACEFMRRLYPAMPAAISVG